jgi:UDP-N-acetylglucosamine--N-acetylmuramyl-(pentapeptide) pyrophosphoryl-undecaprenol N-acetylglucosamine transferase
VAGLTNKVLSKFATRVLAAFPAAFGAKAELVGNPVREDITQVIEPEQRFSAHAGSLRLLVVGGSLGATALNDVIPKALALLSVNERPQVIHQAGVKHIDVLNTNYAQAGVVADTRAFIDDMANMYAWADFVICRSGALTVAEVSAVGLGSLMVPFPFAVDDHQTTNAAYLAEHGAAMLVQQKELSAEKLAGILQTLNREKCLVMAKKARALGKPEATDNVAAICIEVAL